MTSEYDGPLVNVNWEVTPAEWQELRGLLLAAPRTPFIEGLVAAGALG